MKRVGIAGGVGKCVCTGHVNLAKSPSAKNAIIGHLAVELDRVER